MVDDDDSKNVYGYAFEGVYLDGVSYGKGRWVFSDAHTLSSYFLKIGQQMALVYIIWRFEGT